MRILAILITLALFCSSAAAEPVVKPDVFEVAVERVFVRKAPGKYSDNMGVLKKGDCVILLKENKKWLEVKLPDGKTGYVFRDSLKKLDASRTASMLPSKTEPITRSSIPLPVSSAPSMVPNSKGPVTTYECASKKLKDDLAERDAEITQLKVQISQLKKEKEVADSGQKRMFSQQADDRKFLLAQVDAKGEKVYLRGVGEALIFSHEGISVLRVPQSLKQRADTAMAFAQAEVVSINSYVYYIAPSTAFSR